MCGWRLLAGTVGGADVTCAGRSETSTPSPDCSWISWSAGYGLLTAIKPGTSSRPIRPPAMASRSDKDSLSSASAERPS